MMLNRVLPTSLFLLVVALAAPVWAQPAPETTEGTRTVRRDTRRGGPPTLPIEALQPIGDDPELLEALVSLGDGDPTLALDILPGWVDAHRGTELAENLGFALGYAQYLDEQWDTALATLGACAADSDLFADYCLYWAANASFEQGRFTEATALAESVARDAVLGPRSRWLAGRSLASQGEPGAAVERFESFLGDYPEAAYRRDVEFDLAASLVASGSEEDAARLYHRLAILNPGSDTETRATRLLDAIREELPASVQQEVFNTSLAETVDRAQVLFDRHRSEQVVELLTPVMSSSEASAETVCQAAYLVGKSLTKLRQHTDSVVPYERAVDACAGTSEETRVKALYNLGKALWNADRDDDAVATFVSLWTEYPDNSYADDAVLLAARVRRAQGRDADSANLLRQQIDTYAHGDMLGEAVWLLMSRDYGAGRYREAIAFAESIGSRTGETDRYTEGRVAYFRARSLEHLSQMADARSMYEEIVRSHPMAWYSLLALNRLIELDEDAARELVQSLREESPSTESAIELRPPELQQDPFFRRGTTFLRLGLYDLAEGEFGKLRSRYPNEPDIEWVLAMLFDRAGAFHISYHMPGGREDLGLSYPAGSNLERWEITYPRPYGNHVPRFAGERELDPNLVYAVMRQESGFRPDVESWANARGLLQLMIGTARDMARLTGRGTVSERQLFEPAINIELGTMFMRTLADSFEGHPALVIGGYNGGGGHIRSWLRDRGSMPLDLWVEEIPYEQTRNYVKGVTTTYWTYIWLYGDGDGWVRLPYELSGILSE
jgi:soluble lytic murein transglycosylase